MRKRGVQAFAKRPNEGNEQGQGIKRVDDEDGSRAQRLRPDRPEKPGAVDRHGVEQRVGGETEKDRRVNPQALALQRLHEADKRFGDQGRDHGMNDQRVRGASVQHEGLDRIVEGEEHVQVGQRPQNAAQDRGTPRPQRLAEHGGANAGAKNQLSQGIHVRAYRKAKKPCPACRTACARAQPKPERTQ